MPKKKVLEEIHFERFHRDFSRYCFTDPFEYVSKHDTGRVGDYEIKKLVYDCLPAETRYALLQSEQFKGEEKRNLILHAHAYHFLKHGRKVYQFSKNLTDLLLRTSLKKMDADYVRSPHRQIYLTFEKNDFDELRVYDAQDKKFRQIEGIYIYYEDLEVAREKGELPEVLSAGKLFEIPDGTKYFLRYMVVAKLDKKEITVPKGAEGLVSFVFYNNIFMRNGDIFEQLGADYDEKLGGREDLDPGALEQPYQKKFHSFMVNALLYITSADARVEYFQTELPYSGTNATKQRKKNKGCSKIPGFFSVGDKLITGSGTGSGSPIGGGQISVKFKVSAHWHIYWVGKGREQKRLKWIIEYEKGNEFSEVVEKRITAVK